MRAWDIDMRNLESFLCERGIAFLIWVSPRLRWSAMMNVTAQMPERTKETTASIDSVTASLQVFILCHLTDTFETSCSYCVQSSHFLSILCIASLHLVVTHLLPASQQGNFPTPKYVLRNVSTTNRISHESSLFEELCRLIWE